MYPEPEIIYILSLLELHVVNVLFFFFLNSVAVIKYYSAHLWNSKRTKGTTCHGLYMMASGYMSILLIC